MERKGLGRAELEAETVSRRSAGLRRECGTLLQRSHCVQSLCIGGYNIAWYSSLRENIVTVQKKRNLQFINTC